LGSVLGAGYFWASLTIARAKDGEGDNIFLISFNDKELCSNKTQQYPKYNSLTLSLMYHYNDIRGAYAHY
jgi:hypothetical protein